MLSYFYWDPNPECFSIGGFPILWYGVFFALGFWLGFLVFNRLLLNYFRNLATYRRLSLKEMKDRVHKIADRLTLYIVVAAIVGARLGHFLFYESPSKYLLDPIEIFRIREGGLASHGAAIGIILAVLLFHRRYRKIYPELNWIRILDFLSAPAALAGALIRIGNFFNQEILGTPSNLPWAILFGHPADRSAAVPRHPVQLYESFGYLAIFLILWRLSKTKFFLLHQGRLIGIFLILIFTFRLLIEFLKVEQSHLWDSSHFTMGQLLSLPLIGFGILFLWQSRRKVP